MDENFPKLHVKSYVEDQARIYEHSTVIDPTIDALKAYYVGRAKDVYAEEYGDDEEEYDDDYYGSLCVELSFDADFTIYQTATCLEYHAETLQNIKDMYTICQILDELHIKKRYTNNMWFYISIGGETRQLRFWNTNNIVVGEATGPMQIFVRSTLETLKKDLLNLMAK